MDVLFGLKSLLPQRNVGAMKLALDGESR